MNKPRMKRKVAITVAIEDQRIILFYGNGDFAEQCDSFGTIEPRLEKNHYRLTVDGRFDFVEVKEYIKSFETDCDEPSTQS